MKNVIQRILFIIYVIFATAAISSIVAGSLLTLANICLHDTHFLYVKIIFVGIIFLLIAYPLQKIGYNKLDFSNHESTSSEDIRLDFKKEKDFKKWSTLKQYFDEIENLEFLTPIHKHQIRKIISVMAEEEINLNEDDNKDIGYLE